MICECGHLEREHAPCKDRDCRKIVNHNPCMVASPSEDILCGCEDFVAWISRSRKRGAS